MLKLYHHQSELVAKNPTKWLLAHGTGTGKTVTAIKLADNNPCLTVVVCPKQVREKWGDEIKQWSRYPHHYTVISKEKFRKEHGILKPYGCIILDEAHFFGGVSSQMTKHMRAYIRKHDPLYVYLLTATPYLSTPWNIYSYAILLGRKWGYVAFKRTFFYDVRMGKRVISMPKPKMQKQVATLVKRLGNAISLQDCIDVPEQTYLTEYFDLTKEQKQAIDAIEETQHIVRWTKTHQICGGTLKGDEYVASQKFKSEKMKRVIELIKENPKIAVVCRYNHEIEVLKKMVSKFCPVVVLNGKTKYKEEAVRVVHNANRMCILVNAAVSEGYSLETVPIMVFYSYDFSLKNYIQMQGRLLRINALKKNVYISLVVRGTIDEDVFKNVTINKKDFQIKIYETDTNIKTME